VRYRLHESDPKETWVYLISKMISMNYTQIAEIVGLFVLSAFGFYALQLLSSFRTGILAKSWKQVSIGAIFLIFAQFPLIAAALGLLGTYDSSIVVIGTFMRFIGVVFLIIGLRIQYQVWRSESKGLTQRSGSSPPIEV
jgi:hypothetical protein